MASLKTDDGDYSTGQINAVVQFHIFVKIAPLLSSFIKLRMAANSELRPGERKERKLLELGENMDAFALSLSKLPKDDIDFVLSTCLIVCEKRVGGGMMRVWIKDGGLADQTIPLMTMLRLVWAVLQENLQSFFDSAASILPDLAGAAKK